MHYFYMIRKLDTDTYYTHLQQWRYQDDKDAIIWWYSAGLKEAYKVFVKLSEHWYCEIVKFQVEEMNCG